MEERKQTICIVCSDLKGKIIGEVLIGAFDVYRIKSENRGDYLHWQEGGWKNVPEGQLPNNFDALFFHTGGGDIGLIPQLTFNKKFAFSGGGLSRWHSSNAKGHDDAIPIRKPVLRSDCPIKPGHLEELKDFISGATARLPGFCRAVGNLAAVTSLSILCQSYAAAAIAEGSRDDHGIAELSKAIGWDHLTDEVVHNLSTKMEGEADKMRAPQWWCERLGFWDQSEKRKSEEEVKKFLKQLVYDLGLADKKDISNKTQEELGDMLNGSNYEEINRLVSSFTTLETVITEEMVCSAYKKLKSFQEGA